MYCVPVNEVFLTFLKKQQPQYISFKAASFSIRLRGPVMTAMLLTCTFQLLYGNMPSLHLYDMMTIGLFSPLKSAHYDCVTTTMPV